MLIEIPDLVLDLLTYSIFHTLNDNPVAQQEGMTDTVKAVACRKLIRRNARFFYTPLIGTKCEDGSVVTADDVEEMISLTTYAVIVRLATNPSPRPTPTSPQGATPPAPPVH